MSKDVTHIHLNFYDASFDISICLSFVKDSIQTPQMPLPLVWQVGLPKLGHIPWTYGMKFFAKSILPPDFPFIPIRAHTKYKPTLITRTGKKITPKFCSSALCFITNFS